MKRKHALEKGEITLENPLGKALMLIEKSSDTLYIDFIFIL